MENLNPSVVRLSGVLLISGAVTFWSMIIAALVYQMRTGSLPFKDWASVPARDFYESIAVHPGWWRWVNRCFALGIVMTAFGLTALKLALTDAGDRVFAELGWTSFLIGALLWLVLFTFNRSMAIWAAEVTPSQGSMPATFEAWPKWMERIVLIYMILAYTSLAFYGIALLNTGLLASWAGWVALVVGLAGAASVILWGSGFAIPLLIHIVPFLIGILLLLK